MKKVFKRKKVISALAVLLAFIFVFPSFADFAGEGRSLAGEGCSLARQATSLSGEGASPAEEKLTILFTHDMHDYLYPTSTVKDGEVCYHGGAAKRNYLLQQYDGENTIYLDAGDFSMGTLYQAAFSTDAYELRDLGLSGCLVTTFGNHEFDYGAEGVASMLRAAKASGDPLPQIVLSNIDFSGELTSGQQDLKAAFDEYGIKEYTVLEKAGYRIGIFGLEGYDSIECIQTDIPFTDYIEQAKTTVAALKEENCDLIIALSHAGTGSREEGEDIDLAKAVPDIDIIISAHTHCCYDTPIQVGNTLVVSCGEYLNNVGRLTVSKKDGILTAVGYELLRVDETVPEDPEELSRLEAYRKDIEEGYLADKGGSFDKVIAHSGFSMISLNEMYATHQEYTTGDLIADSYIYEAERNGIYDIDVALVGLGTIRGSITEGDISVADAFEICSLGVGGDGSAGHPLVVCCLTGKDLKLMTELDASLGTLVNSIKMSYSGLEFKFNEERQILDRVTEVHLKRKDGSTEEIDDKKLYKVCANMYAVNMLGMLNGLTRGVLSITPLDDAGLPVTDFYAKTMRAADGTEVKEWVAFKNYLESFPVGDSGLPEIPEEYAEPQGRKVKYSNDSAEAKFGNQGTATRVMPVLEQIVAGLIVLIILIVLLVRRRKKRRKAKAAALKAAREAAQDAAGEEALRKAEEAGEKKTI